MMKLLVTGATGFIGAWLCERTLMDGHDVLGFGLDRLEIERERKGRLEAAGGAVEIGSLEDEALLSRLVRDRDVVIHLAAAQHESNVPDAHFRAVNVEGTRKLVRASREAGVGRFVYGSTIGVFGSAADTPLDESSPVSPGNIYAATKLEAEDVVRSESADMPWCIARISEAYGPGDGRLLKLFKSIDKGLFPMIGAGANERHPVYVDDLVDGLMLAARRPEAVGETFVLAGKEILTTRETAEAIAAALGKPLRTLRLPLWAMNAAALVLESTLPRVGLSPPLNRRRLDFFVKRFHFSQDKPRRLLGYEPEVGFREGAARTAAWYRENGYLPSAAAT